MATSRISVSHDLAPFSLIDGAKLQNKILPTKRFLDLVSFVNKYYPTQDYPTNNPRDTAKQSMRKFGNFCKILVNYPPDSAVPFKTPILQGRANAGTQVHFVKSYDSVALLNSILYIIYIIIYIIYKYNNINNRPSVCSLSSRPSGFFSPIFANENVPAYLRSALES